MPVDVNDTTISHSSLTSLSLSPVLVHSSSSTEISASGQVLPREMTDERRISVGEKQFNTIWISFTLLFVGALDLASLRSPMPSWFEEQQPQAAYNCVVQQNLEEDGQKKTLLVLKQEILLYNMGRVRLVRPPRTYKQSSYFLPMVNSCPGTQNTG